MSDSKPASKTKSAAFGAGIGTMLLGMSEYIPDEYTLLKALVVYGSPTVSVFLGACWIVASNRLANFYDERLLNKALIAVRAECEIIRNNPNSTPQHIANSQEIVEKMEMVKMGFLQESTRSVKTILAEVSPQA